MNSFLVATIAFSMVFTAFSQLFPEKCPSLYLRYSSMHSYCKPANLTCLIFNRGVTDAEKKQIVNLHNEYRNKVASGKEPSAGGLPPAADMMQMVWDPELSAVAQKFTEQCIYEHDCYNCRRVKNFGVGQNIAYLEKQCVGIKCLNATPDWPTVLKMFYDEAAVFDKALLSSVKFLPDKEFGHFTQMIWAKTFRTGCGFVAYEKGNGYRQFYACNYGPAGNMIGAPVYKPGDICSACPINACCGSSCVPPESSSLCRMLRNDEAPIYPTTEKEIFYCDFRSKKKDCNAGVEGIKKFKYIKALGGPFAEIVLKGGESSTLKMTNVIKPSQPFCFDLMYRSGPNVDGQMSSNEAVIKFDFANASPVSINLPRDPGNQEFFQFSMDLGWTRETKVSVTFSVPEGAPSQYFNMKNMTAQNGKCRNGT